MVNCTRSRDMFAATLPRIMKGKIVLLRPRAIRLMISDQPKSPRQDTRNHSGDHAKETMLFHVTAPLTGNFDLPVSP